MNESGGPTTFQVALRMKCRKCGLNAAHHRLGHRDLYCLLLKDNAQTKWKLAFLETNNAIYNRIPTSQLQKGEFSIRTCILIQEGLGDVTVGPESYQNQFAI